MSSEHHKNFFRYIKTSTKFKWMQKNRAENFTTIEVDQVTDEHYVIIPEWVLDEQGWYEGTEVNIEVENDCIVISDIEDS